MLQANFIIYLAH